MNPPLPTTAGNTARGILLLGCALCLERNPFSHKLSGGEREGGEEGKKRETSPLRGGSRFFFPHPPPTRNKGEGCFLLYALLGVSPSFIPGDEDRTRNRRVLPFFLSSFLPQTGGSLHFFSLLEGFPAENPPSF